ncbi:endo-1,4-beta-xylanase [Embleya sp. AB8]|uniref:endo-1,4-beta-xylanase n=1 Tax=Embleya sp. AB8 TaxID=3156304 RepID=UPI003C752CCE
MRPARRSIGKHRIGALVVATMVAIALSASGCESGTDGDDAAPPPTIGAPSAPGSGSAPGGARDDTNLLAGRDWGHFAGASVAGEVVRIRPLGRAIVKQDGSGGQANPPVNLRGPHLEVAGDFEVAATLRDTAAAPAYLQLYGEVPVVYDEWRQERRSVRLGVVGGRLEVALWDGRKAEPVRTETMGAKLPAEVALSMRRGGGRLEFRAGEAVLGSVADHDVFGAGRIWFGADAGVGGPGWELAALRVRALPGGRATIVDAPALGLPHTAPDALRTVAAGRKRPVDPGVAVAAGPLYTDQDYRTLIAGQFSMLTPENDMKPQFVHPRPDVYDFADADSMIDFARANEMKVHGHTLVFGEALPRWMREVSRGERERVMTEHIATVAGHFRGRVAEWDVVNEPLSIEDADYAAGKPGLRQHIWQEGMGEQYLDKAFRAARAADPDAALFLNEFGIEENGPRWDALLALVKRLKARGVPIDGVGFQTHIHDRGDHLDQAVFGAHLKALADLGIRSRVSEIDVHGEDREAQAEQFAVAMRTCAAAPTCGSFGTWGATDHYGSTAEHDSYPLSVGDELMWDTKQEPKPAVEAVRAALRSD